MGEEPSDLLDQVPVDWTVSVDLEQYEIFLLANRYNWLDLSSGGVENTRLAFCGASGQLSLRLPFTNFIPLEQLVQFSAKVSRMTCTVHVCLCRQSVCMCVFKMHIWHYVYVCYEIVCYEIVCMCVIRVRTW